MNFYSLPSQNFKKAILVISGILFLMNLWLIDYEHLLSRENLGNVLGGISNIFLVAAMAVSINHTKKERDK